MHHREQGGLLVPTARESMKRHNTSDHISQSTGIFLVGLLKDAFKFRKDIVGIQTSLWSLIKK